MHAEGLLGVYELNQVDRQRDVFISAYERSCQLYVALRQHLVPAQALRLQYRRELSATVAARVRAGETPNAKTARAAMPASVARADRNGFVALVVNEFGGPHAGNAVRFGIGALEFDRWQRRRRQEPVGLGASKRNLAPARMVLPGLQSHSRRYGTKSR